MLSPCDNVIQLLVHMLMLTGLTLKFSNIEYTALHSQQKHTLTHTQPFYGHCKVNLCHRQCYKLLERLTLHRISPDVEDLLSPDQAGFRLSLIHI